MKNTMVMLLSFFLLMSGGIISMLRAQSRENKIQEVVLSSADGFGELRKLLKDNFDFTAQDYKEGTVNSNVRFSLTENGKITNIHATGDCENVSKEIENVLSRLIYKVDVGNMNRHMLASSYVMPVSVTISNR